MNQPRGVAIILTTLWLSLGCSVTAAQESGSLFKPIPVEQLAGADLPPPDPVYVQQQTYMTLDKTLLLERVVEPASMGLEVDPVPMTLPNGESITIVTDDVNTTANGDEPRVRLLNWTGHLQDVPLSRVSFIGLDDGSIIGDITYNDRVYQIRSGGPIIGGQMQYSVIEPAAPTTIPFEPPPFITDGTAGTVTDSHTFSEDLPPTYVPRMDIMVLYTNEAKALLESVYGTEIDSQIELAVQRINAAFAAQQISATLNLVYTQQVEVQFSEVIAIDTADPPSPETDSHLEQLIDRNDGYLDEVHSLRDRYKADLVSVWVKGGGDTAPCGNATLLLAETNDFADKAFSIVSAHCILKYNSFVHEISHNLGAGHQSPYGIGRFQFSHGYVQTGTRVSTVESSLYGCGQCTRFKDIVWSDPDYKLGGLQWGDAEISNNKATIVATAPFIESLDTKMSPLGTGPGLDSAALPPSAALGGKLPGINADLQLSQVTPSTSILDVLVLRGPDDHDSVFKFIDEVELATAELNKSFQASGVSTQVRIVAIKDVDIESQEVSFQPSPGTLNALTDSSDGWLDEVHNYRAETKADIVALWFSGTDELMTACGLANMFGGTPTSGFLIVNGDCASTNFGFAHAIGHILGARHELAADPSVEPFPQGHGYVDLENGWRTIMAYGIECVEKRCPRRGVWSNPRLGTGTPSADNASVLNATSPTVARYSEMLEQVSEAR